MEVVGAYGEVVGPARAGTGMATGSVLSSPLQAASAGRDGTACTGTGTLPVPVCGGICRLCHPVLPLRSPDPRCREQRPAPGECWPHMDVSRGATAAERHGAGWQSWVASGVVVMGTPGCWGCANIGFSLN